MWNSGVSGFAGARAGVTPGVVRGETPTVAPVVEVTAVRQFLNELFDAQQDRKGQTVRETRDKLNAVREKMGDEPFKSMLNRLIEDADRKSLEFLKLLLRGWFPEGDEAGPSLSKAKNR